MSAAAVLLAACGTAQVSRTAPASSPTPTAPAEPTPTATVVPSEAPVSEAPAGPLSIVTCPIPRPTSPACLDGASNGEAPALTEAVRVGGTVSVAITIHNSGTAPSPPVTILFFTYEPPAVGTFLQPTACNGCSIGLGGNANGVQWSGVDPGDHVLTVTLTAVGRPSLGMDANGDYQWLFAAYAQPYSVAAHGPEGIDVSQAFGSGTGATQIMPR